MPTSRVKLDSLDRIPLGQGRCYIVGGETIAVFRQRDGRLFGTQSHCPHRQGPLSEGIIGSGTVVCPLHAHRFDLADGCGSDPEECLTVYDVEERDGSVWVTPPSP